MKQKLKIITIPSAVCNGSYKAIVHTESGKTFFCSTMTPFKDDRGLIAERQATAALVKLQDRMEKGELFV